MTAKRIGMFFLAIGIALLVAGVVNRANSDLLHIGAVGCIVFGAMAISVSTEAKNNGLPARVKPARPAAPESKDIPG